MSDVKIHTNNGGQVTCVPNAFIDNYMKDANGEYVKVYLYLLRCLGDMRMDLSIPGIADALDLTEKDVRRALFYWQKQSLIRLEYNDLQKLTGICMLDLKNTVPSHAVEDHAIPAEENTAPLDKAGTSARKGQIVPMPQSGRQAQEQHVSADNRSDSAVNVEASNDTDRPMYSASQLSEFQKDDSVKEMLYITGRYIGHPLTVMEMNTILYWQQALHFSTDLIEYLVEYCVEKGHTSIHYMDKVALSWADQHFTSVDEAKAASDMHSKLYYQVMRAFGISGRNLASSEIGYLEKWTEEYGMDQELILEACRRTISNIAKPSFEYADTILKNWSNAGVHHLADIAKLDQEHEAALHRNMKKQATSSDARQEDRNRFHRFAHSDYDPDALAKALMNN